MFILMVNRVNPDTDPKELEQVIPMHINWVREKISDGSILQAGKWDSFGGMAIIKSSSVEEAEEFLQDDPLIRSGLVSCTIGQFFPMVQHYT